MCTTRHSLLLQCLAEAVGVPSIWLVALVSNKAEKWSPWSIIPSISAGWDAAWNNMWQWQRNDPCWVQLKTQWGIMILKADWAIMLMFPCSWERDKEMNDRFWLEANQVWCSNKTLGWLPWSLFLLKFQYCTQHLQTGCRSTWNDYVRRDIQH